MSQSVLVNKAENYLKEISNDSISVDEIDDFENFKDLYFKLDDRLNYLMDLKDDMDAQGYTTPFTSLNKYGTKTVADVSIDEMGENSRHNQIFRMKANAKKIFWTGLNQLLILIKLLLEILSNMDMLNAIHAIKNIHLMSINIIMPHVAVEVRLLHLK